MSYRFAFAFGLRPGTVQEYRRRHDEIWPEMLLLLDEVGISDYSIYAFGDLLVGVLRCSRPWEEVQRDLALSPVQARWAAAMADLLEWQLDDDGRLRELDEVFRFDGEGDRW